jgi:Zn-dependent protease with chaperone function
MVYTGIIVGLMAAMENGRSEFITVVATYAIAILVMMHVLRGLLVGYIKGNAVRIGPHQFADIYQTVAQQSKALGLGKVPAVYLLQQGGLLNAFATRFMGSDYIVLYSDLMEEAYEQNKATVDFVIAHELGHVKRNHILKRLIVFPSFIVPFLPYAYSRACEYTCDSIGASLSNDGARTGLVVLAAGKRLYRHVNTQQFVEQMHTERGFWYWFSEKASTHPHLVKRLARFPEPVAVPRNSGWNTEKPTEPQPAPAEQKQEDISRFMPR